MRSSSAGRRVSASDGALSRDSFGHEDRMPAPRRRQVDAVFARNLAAHHGAPAPARQRNWLARLLGL